MRTYDTYETSGRLWEVKSKRKLQFIISKVVAIANESWSLTRGSNYSDLTGKILVFWKSGHLREVVAPERCSQRGSSTVVKCFTT